MNELPPSKKLTTAHVHYECLERMPDDEGRSVRMYDADEVDAEIARLKGELAKFIKANAELALSHTPEPQPAASKEQRFDFRIEAATLKWDLPEGSERPATSAEMYMWAEIESLQRQVDTLFIHASKWVTRALEAQQRAGHEPPAECDGCEQYAVMHAEIALALDIHDEADAHHLQELILTKLRAAQPLAELLEKVVKERNELRDAAYTAELQRLAQPPAPEYVHAGWLDRDISLRFLDIKPRPVAPGNWVPLYMQRPTPTKGDSQ